MKRLFIGLISAAVFCVFSIPGVLAADYTARVNLFSNECPIPQRPYSFYFNFEREIDLSSVKMSVAGKKDKTIPIYIEPVAKYRALIHFMPIEKLEEDSGQFYELSFKSGKWNACACGDNKFKKSITLNPNLISNNSFEKVTKTIERFWNWAGRTSVIDWTLQDYPYRYAKIDSLNSTCRVSDKEAYQGKRSLCFKTGMPRQLGKVKLLISGDAFLKKEIPLKPQTAYKLSFFVKVTEQKDNGMNFQGVGVTLSLLDANKKQIPGGILTTLFSTTTRIKEDYINKWVYIESYDITPENTALGRLRIGEKISGTIYVDMLELREVKDCNVPEIIIGKTKEIIPVKILKRADGTVVK